MRRYPNTAAMRRHNRNFRTCSNYPECTMQVTLPTTMCTGCRRQDWEDTNPVNVTMPEEFWFWVSRDASKTVGTIRSIFCPVHRRRADFRMRDSGDPENPNVVCPNDGYRLSYKELTQ